MRMRDCQNLQVMLYSQTEVSDLWWMDALNSSSWEQPVIEASTNIKFVPMVYSYPELFTHMRSAMVSPWTNSWTAIFDFTPHKVSTSGEPNFFCEGELTHDFIRPLWQARSLIEKATVSRGKAPTSLNEVTQEELDQIQPLLEQESLSRASEAPAFSLGDYFDAFVGNMLKTVPPTRQY